VNHAELVAMVEHARLRISDQAGQTMVTTGERDDRFGLDRTRRTARLAVAAWAMAVAGNDSTLTALATAQAADQLMHSYAGPWQMAPDPVVTLINISRLDGTTDPPLLHVSFEFTGRRKLADGTTGDEREFIGHLDFRLHYGSSWPWQLDAARVSTLDDWIGYAFTSRRETQEEYADRTGQSGGVPGPGPTRTFRVTSGFAEHDERFGSTAMVDVQRGDAPERAAAEALIWPAIDAKTVKALGEGEWRPSMNWLDVIELLEANPAHHARSDPIA
jgi:hypothetical protein